MWKASSSAALIVATLFAISLQATNAADDGFDQFYRFVEVKNKVIEPHLPGEMIDRFTGDLHIVQRDLFFPGKGGLDLDLVRTYSSKIWLRSDTTNTLEPLLANVNSPIGFGWSIHMGFVRDPNPTGATTNPSFPVYEAPNGSSRVFYPCLNVGETDSPACATGVQSTSRDHWKYVLDCPTSQSVCITTTGGRRLEFDQSNKFFIGTTLVLPLSAIADVFGNRIEVTYQPGGLGQSNNGRIDHITDSYNRTVVFHYGGCGSQTCLTSITADGNGVHREVDYTYTTYTRSTQTDGQGHFPLPSPNPQFLQSAKMAVGGGDTYDYGFTNTVAQNQYALTTITYPNGGRSEYSYTTTSFFTGCYTVVTPDLASADAHGGNPQDLRSKHAPGSMELLYQFAGSHSK
jgi:hypothetical protein